MGNVSAVLSSWRLVELLATGSVLLLQEDFSRELISHWLTPWEHFVPVSANLSDLVDKIRWLEAHPTEAEAIAARGFELFTHRVRRQDTYCYTWQALGTLARATMLEPLPTSTALRKDGWREVDAASVLHLPPDSMPLKQLLAAAQA